MANTVQPVAVGIIGCGTISKAYLEAAKEFPTLDVVACADMDGDVARQRAAEFGISAPPVDALLDDPTIELVINLTTPQAHVEVGLAAIAAGKHVYSEKPLATSTSSGRRLLEAANDKDLLVGCAPDTFLGSAHQAARKVIDDGGIGRPIAGTAFFMNRGHESWHPNPDFYYQAGGGPMFDMGPYYITALIDFLGPVARVSGSANTNFPERVIGSQNRAGERIPVEVPTHVCGLLEFVDGATIMVATSFDVWRHSHGHMEIYGSEGSLIVPDPNRFDGDVAVSARGDDWSEVSQSHDQSGKNLRSIGAADMAGAIREARAHRANGALAFHVLEVMEAFERSSKAGRFIDIRSRCERPEAMPAPSLAASNA